MHLCKGVSVVTICLDVHVLGRRVNVVSLLPKVAKVARWSNNVSLCVCSTRLQHSMSDMALFFASCFINLSTNSAHALRNTQIWFSGHFGTNFVVKQHEELEARYSAKGTLELLISVPHSRDRFSR